MGKGGGYTQWSERAGGAEGGEAGGGVKCGTMGSMGDGLEVETARTGGRRVGRPGETEACGRLGVGARGGWGSLVCRESAATVPCGATRDGVGTRATWKLSPTPQGALATSRCVPATRYNSHSHVALHHPPCDPPLAPPPPTSTPPPSSPSDCTPPPHGTRMVPQPPTSLLLLPSPARHHPWRLPWPPRSRRGSGGGGGSVARLLGFPRPFCALVHPFPAPGCPCFRGASPSALSMVDVSGHRRWGGCGGG